MCLADAGPDGALFEVLARWARVDPRPLVLLIDEIDTLVGDTLLSVLRASTGIRRRSRNWLLQAFLQKVVNGGGRIEREYALDRGRVDLLILWPHGRRTRRFVVECKVRRDGLEQTVREGVEQTRGYMVRCRAEAGHPIVFDRSESRTWEEKLFRRAAPVGSGVAPVTVRGM